MRFNPARSSHGRVITAATLAAGLLLAAASSGSAVASAPGPGGLPVGCSYSVERLPLPSDWPQTGGTAHGNGARSYVGWGMDATGLTRPLLWRNGKVRVLPSPGGVAAAAQDVNGRGEVLTNTQTSPAVPYVWHRGTVVSLAAPAGATYTIGYAVNDSGLVVGYSNFGGATHGLTWSISTPGSYRDWGIGAGDLFLTGVTNAGVIIGRTQSRTGASLSVGLSGTESLGLAALPGVNTTRSSQAFWAAGDFVLGSGALPGAPANAWGVLWKNGIPTALPPTIRSQAVNAKGLIAGTDSLTPNSAIAWAAGTTWTLPALNPTGSPNSTYASDVLEKGAVIGSSESLDGNQVPVVWTCR